MALRIYYEFDIDDLADRDRQAESITGGQIEFSGSDGLVRDLGIATDEPLTPGTVARLNMDGFYLTRDACLQAMGERDCDLGRVHDHEDVKKELDDEHG